MDQECQAAWDDKYRSEGCIWGAAPNQFLADFAADLPPGRVLDLGCGQGRNAVWLAGRGHEVTAVDLSPVAISQASQLARSEGVQVLFIAADVMSWEPKVEAYDLVLLSYVQLPEPDRRVVHAKAAAAVASGGIVFVIAHHLDNLTQGVGGPPSPDVLFTEKMLEADFAALEIETSQRVIRHVERQDISGDAVDVLLVARRKPA